MRTLITSFFSCWLIFASSACGDGDPKTKDSGVTAGSAATVDSATGADSSTASKCPDAVLTVMIKDFKFDPNPVNAKMEDTIRFINMDSVTHTVSSDAGSPLVFDSGGVGVNQEFCLAVDKIGSFGYHCNTHSVMKAKLEVTAR